MTHDITTPEGRAKLREMEAQATPGPWHDCALDPEGCGGWDVPTNGTLPKAPTGALIQSACHTSAEAVVGVSNYDHSPWCLPEDRALIVAARNNLISVCDALDARDAEIARLTSALGLIARLGIKRGKAFDTVMSLRRIAEKALEP